MPERKRFFSIEVFPKEESVKGEKRSHFISHGRKVNPWQMVNLVLDRKPTDNRHSFHIMDLLVWADIWVELCLKTLQVSKELNKMIVFSIKCYPCLQNVHCKVMFFIMFIVRVKTRIGRCCNSWDKRQLFTKIVCLLHRSDLWWRCCIGCPSSIVQGWGGFGQE